MTPHEQARFLRLVSRVAELEPKVKDPAAEALISAGMTKLPSLGYWLACRVLLLERALGSAEAQIELLQNELRDRTARANGTERTGPRAAPRFASGTAGTPA